MDKKTEIKKESKGLPTIAKFGIGCFILLALVGIGLAATGKFLFSRFGANMVKKGIEQKTGVSIDMEKGGEGFVYKDKRQERKLVLVKEKFLLISQRTSRCMPTQH